MLTISTRDETVLLVNDEVVPDSIVYHTDTDRLYVVLENSQTARLLTGYHVSELANELARLDVYLDSPFPDFHLSASFRFGSKEASASRLEISYGIIVDEWAGPWSISQYERAIIETREAYPDSGFQVPEVGTFREDAAGTFIRSLDDPTATAEAILNRWLPSAEQIIRKAREALMAEIDHDTLVTLFDFPRHVSTACEQYLLYFVQFLRDLGIEAGASITHEAYQVLFSVTPRDGAEALDRIREALDIYLRLPDSPEFATQAPAYGDIAVQQLQANIFHLKGQLAVAGAVLQAKNAQIEALQLSNFTYQQLLATQQQAATLPLLAPGTSAADAEPLVPGVIEVTKYEGKGFTVNLPELLRRLKRNFNQE